MENNQRQISVRDLTEEITLLVKDEIVATYTKEESAVGHFSVRFENHKNEGFCHWGKASHRRRVSYSFLGKNFRTALARTPVNSGVRQSASCAKKRASRIANAFLAQEEGFEPPWAFTQTVFKTASL